MTPYYDQDGITIYVGDNADILPQLPAESVSALVSDPPAGISFMNKDWDGSKGGRDHWVTWLASVLAECERVMLPGAHALVWALPRTSGWTHRAIEDAGLDVRDCIAHLFGSGFPKSHNLKGEWDGWGTALKPGAEFWYLARKPLAGTVAANVLQHGTGALNIDASRIPGTKGVPASPSHTPFAKGASGFQPPDMSSKGWDATAGRWPANVVLDEAAAEALDRQSGVTKSTAQARHNKARPADEVFFGQADKVDRVTGGYSDTGGASRFFYVAKASRKERNAGLDGMPEVSPFERGGPSANFERMGSKSTARQNHHPTVKPLALMRYLVTLVTPPGGIVLDPFAGSGSTLVACAELGIPAIGIELSEEYAEIAARRVQYAQQQTKQAVLV